MAGCATDHIDVPGVSTSGFADDDGSASADGADDAPPGDVGDDTTGGGEDGEEIFVDCDLLDPTTLESELDPEVAALTETERTFPAGLVCPGLGFEFDEEFPQLNDFIGVSVVRPDPMPDAPLPIVTFIAGVGQSSAQYTHIHDALAELGFLVLNVTNSPSSVDLELRKRRLACALRWLRWEPDPEGSYADDGRPSVIEAEHISCSASSGGHSNGGRAAYEVVAERFSTFADEWAGYDAAAIFSIAPATTSTTMPVGQSVPLLVIGTEIEDEVPGGAQAMFDLAAAEADSGAPARYMIETYVAGHHSFGGSPVAPGSNIATEYIASFLGWRVLDRNAEDARALLTTQRFPESLLDSSNWFSHAIYANRDFSGGIDCSQILDPGSCESTRGCFLRADDSCVGRPLILSSYYVDEVHLGAERNVLRTFQSEVLADENQAYPTIADGPTMVVDDAAVVLDAVSSFSNGVRPGHSTDLALIEWGGPLDGVEGTVTVGLGGLDLRSYTHASIRIGQASALDAASTGCTAERETPIVPVLGLVDADGQAPSLDMDPLVHQDAAGDSHGVCSTPALQVDCCASQYMHTQRFALADLCAQGLFAIDDVESLVLELPEELEASRVMVDTIEFTYSPFDEPEPGTECPSQQFMWACEVDDLLVSETSCGDEPASGACGSLDTTITAVNPPQVVATTGAFSGWAVHTPAGWVRDPQNLTSAELTAIEGLCAEACELEWSDQPFVAADDCSAADAFLTPYVLSETSHRSHRRIPEAYASGSGLFESDALSCDLRTDCCEQFQEDVCVGRPDRTTEASQPLGRGEAWLIDVDGITWADSTFAAGPVAASMNGSIGYSFCAAGDGESCPFYLGSLELGLSEPLELELVCNGLPQVHEIDSLAISLAQPAFGAAEDGTSWKAFPPGSVVLEAAGVVDGIPFASRRPIEQSVYFQVGEGWTQLQGTGGAFLDFEVPCNGEIADVKVAWAFDDTTIVESPPSVSISGMPSTIACPDTLTLQVSSGSDPENDLASLRWIVDGVLLEESMTSMTFTDDHEITAVLRDARGATASDTKLITCQ